MEIKWIWNNSLTSTNYWLHLSQQESKKLILARTEREKAGHTQEQVNRRLESI